jgi:hypothetical protein
MLVFNRREYIDCEKVPRETDCKLGWGGDCRRSATIDIKNDQLRDDVMGKVNCSKPSDPAKPSLNDLAILDMVIK